jgi:uncharacterized RmlC-like cupin family protein
MTAMSEIIRSEGKRVGDAQKASVVSAGAKYRGEQGSHYEPDVSAETVVSKVVFLGIVTLPAGARTRAHVHEWHETALYLLSGEIEVWTGDQLQHSKVVRPGDYIYIPANVLHVAVNRGEKPAVCIGTRNEPTAQKASCSIPRWTPGYRKQCRGIVKDAR